MESPLVSIVVLVLGFLIVDVAALRFGYDSRSGVVELPLGLDPVVKLPRLTGHGVRLRRPIRTRRKHVPIDRQLPLYRPCAVYCDIRFDLAASGK